MARFGNWHWATVVVAGVMMCCWGCQKQSTPQTQSAKDRPSASIPTQPAEQSVVAEKSDSERGRATTRPVPPTPPPPPTIPKISMTEKQLETCLVKVDAALPDEELQDAEGKPRPVRSLLGKRATVVLFWNADNLYAVQALQDLDLDVAQPYSPKGVAVVGINVRDSAADARKAIAQTAVKYPNLLDADGSYFAKVAAGKPPRIYLTDGAGKVLWMDIEYSATTRRQLAQAIKAVLGGGQ